jgi:site-specific DNA recombinase
MSVRVGGSWAGLGQVLGALLAAIYVRKSTDQAGVSDEQRSVTRQIEHARQYAAQRGWLVREDCIYVDDGISGAEFVKRPGFLRLMNALKPHPPFQVLIMSEESRLGREAIETSYALKQILDAGVRVFYYLEDRERTLDSATDKVLLAVTSYASELERERAQQRTHDALLRKARAGHVTGGRVYGYDNVEVSAPGPDGRPKRQYVTRQINPAQAAVVRRLFERCAAGWGFTRMAKALNAEHVAPPRPGGTSWAPTAIREMLLREDYRGIVRWNRTQKVHRGGTRGQRQRPPEDIVTTEVPALRIVSDALWAAAHAQLAQRRRAFAARLAPGMPGAAAPRVDQPSPYLLSGLGRCVCGGALIAMSRHHGRRRGYFYGCAYNWKRGPAVCRNNLHLPQAVLETAVLETVATQLDADVVAAAVAEARRRLGETARQGAERRLALEQELRLVRAREQRLAEAIAQGRQPDAAPDAVLDALRTEQGRRIALEAQIAQVREPVAGSARDRQRLEHQLRHRAAAVRSLLLRRLPQGRAVLRALLVDRMTFTPVITAGTRGYRFAGHGSYGGLLTGTTWPTTNGGPNGIRTRVCSPPRAFSIRSRSCTMLTQHITSRDSNSAGILVPFSCRAFLAAA